MQTHKTNEKCTTNWKRFELQTQQ